MYALVDCNNFYVSCERVFQPELRGVPCIVLSNNDGCAIARSQEAKDLGIKMGDPLFELRPLIAKHGIQVRSSNYTLYASMSRRVQQVLQLHAGDVEIYSIDEAFLDLTPFMASDLKDHGLRMKAQVQRWTGIPVGVGIAHTKTLAKAANHWAKKHPDTGQVHWFRSQEEADEVLRQQPVDDVWGIGPRWAAKLEARGIKTAYDLSRMPTADARKLMNVVGERTVRELRGERCGGLELEATTAKSLVRSRSFGNPVTERAEMEAAVATYAARACDKLRHRGLVASAFTVFMQTSRFRTNEPQRSVSAGFSVTVGTSDTLQVTAGALAAVRSLWAPGYRYAKAGIMAAGIEQADHRQPGLFEPASPRSDQLMAAMDTINRRHGRDTVRVAAATLRSKQGGRRKESWQMKRDHHSPRFTTSWSELMRAVA